MSQKISAFLLINKTLLPTWEAWFGNWLEPAWQMHWHSDMSAVSSVSELKALWSHRNAFFPAAWSEHSLSLASECTYARLFRGWIIILLLSPFCFFLPFWFPFFALCLLFPELKFGPECSVDTPNLVGFSSKRGSRLTIANSFRYTGTLGPTLRYPCLTSEPLTVVFISQFICFFYLFLLTISVHSVRSTCCSSLAVVSTPNSFRIHLVILSIRVTEHVLPACFIIA